MDSMYGQRALELLSDAVRPSRTFARPDGATALISAAATAQIYAFGSVQPTCERVKAYLAPHLSKREGREASTWKQYLAEVAAAAPLLRGSTLCITSLPRIES